MPYVSGTASSAADLLSAVSSALTTNGYTNSGNLFHKGTLFVEITNQTTFLRIFGGRGKDGSNNLTGFPPTIGGYVPYSSMGAIGSSGLNFPCDYFIHILTSPDEVYIFVNDDGDRYSWMAFGQSPIATLPGTGNWYGASVFGQNTVLASASWSAVGGPSNNPGAGPFVFATPSGATSNAPLTQNTFFHHDLDPGGVMDGWSCQGNVVGNSFVSGGWSNSPSMASAFIPIRTMFAVQPNQFNGESVMFRCRPFVSRDSNKWSVVGDIAHMRYLRIDNYEPQDTLTLGSDSWRVYPGLRKNSAVRDGGNLLTHSGTFGMAIRYDGA